jgi:hypothetical protein
LVKLAEESCMWGVKHKRELGLGPFFLYLGRLGELLLGAILYISETRIRILQFFRPHSEM